jgi:hypothetical protein
MEQAYRETGSIIAAPAWSFIVGNFHVGDGTFNSNQLGRKLR